jgi:hypothetical protein
MFTIPAITLVAGGYRFCWQLVSLFFHMVANGHSPLFLIGTAQSSLMVAGGCSLLLLKMVLLSSLMVTGWLQSTSVEVGSHFLFSLLLAGTASADGWHQCLLSWSLMGVQLP